MSEELEHALNHQERVICGEESPSDFRDELLGVGARDLLQVLDCVCVGLAFCLDLDPVYELVPGNHAWSQCLKKFFDKLRRWDLPALEHGLCYPCISKRTGSSEAERRCWCERLNTTGFASSCRRFVVCSMYPVSISIPIALRPVRIAAKAVVPEPEKGSRTRSPSEVEARRMRSRRATGFWVGCLPNFFSQGSGGLISQTDFICLPRFCSFMSL